MICILFFYLYECKIKRLRDQSNSNYVKAERLQDKFLDERRARNAIVDKANRIIAERNRIIEEQVAMLNRVSPALDIGIAKIDEEIKDSRIAWRDRIIREKNDKLDEADIIINEKDRIIKSKNRVIADGIRMRAERDKIIEGKNRIIDKLKAKLERKNEIIDRLSNMNAPQLVIEPQIIQNIA